MWLENWHNREAGSYTIKSVRITSTEVFSSQTLKVETHKRVMLLFIVLILWFCEWATWKLKVAKKMWHFALLTSVLSFINWVAAPGFRDIDWLVVHCPICPISIVPIPSSNEEIRLVDDAFGKISHMVSDGSWMVRVQAAKTLVRKQNEMNTHSIHLSSSL